MGAVPLSCHVILHRYLRPSSLVSFSLFKQSTPSPLRTTPFHYTFTPSRTPICSFSTIPVLEPQNDAVVDGSKEVSSSGSSDNNNVEVVSNVKLPSLSVKEKKELSSYAHSLGKKLKSQQIGKSGVTDTVITALVETLEKNELLKLKIHNNCPAELDDAVKQVEEGTGSVVVGQIGRTVILYRPSMTKLKAEEKKKQVQRLIMKKQLASKHSRQQMKGQIPSQSDRRRRGSSRV